MLHFNFLRPDMTQEHLGYIPMFLDENNPEPAAKQIDNNYRHGGGWSSFKHGWTYHPISGELKYPGDPPMKPVACAILRDEAIYVYPYSWVLIVQSNGEWDLARID